MMASVYKVSNDPAAAKTCVSAHTHACTHLGMHILERKSPRRYMADS